MKKTCVISETLTVAETMTINGQDCSILKNLIIFLLPLEKRLNKIFANMKGHI